MKIANLTYQEAKKTGCPFNRSIYNEGFYSHDESSGIDSRIDKESKKTVEKSWTEEDLKSNDFNIYISPELQKVYDDGIKKEKVSDGEHIALRIAVMRSSANEIRSVNYANPKLLNAFDGLALVIAEYHNKTESIRVLKELGAKIDEKFWQYRKS